MKKYTLFAAMVCLLLSSATFAGMVHQDWDTGVAGSRQAIIDFLGDLVNPTPPVDLEEVIDESLYRGSKDNYVAKFYGWVTVPETGSYQFHYACDDYGMLYVSQDEEMINAEEVAWVDGWCANAEWDKYPSQHSETMELRAGQIMAVMAFYQEAGGGDNMDIGWTGPGLSSDITNPTYLTDYITHIPPVPTRAKGPVPEVGASDLPRDTDLNWTPGKFAATHDVYLGTNFDDVNDATRDDPRGVLVSENQAAETYDPGILEFGATYYWRIDEVNAPPTSTIYKGKVWEFTIEPFAYAIEGVIATSNAVSDATAGPEKIVDGSGLNAAGEHTVLSEDMWHGVPAGDDPVYLMFEFDQVYKLHEVLVWNYNEMFELMLGFGLKSVTVEHSLDGENWTVLGDVELNQATASPDYTTNSTIEFGGIPVKFVKLTINSNHGFLPQYGVSEIQFMQIPAHGREPQPADGATGVSVATALSWRAGREAVSHEISLGTDSEALASIGTSNVPTVTPGVLDLATDYYWQVTEVNEADAITAWAGAIWSFTTEDFIVVDDFESYIDDEGGRIYETWVDGYGIPSNGSTVGHLESPFAEQSIVNNGSQSMPLFYENAGTSMSEAELTITQDWTASLVKSLTLSFQGDADNTGGQLYVKINGTKIVYPGPAGDLRRAAWVLWSIDLAAAGNVSNVTSLIIGVEGAGASGVVYIDDVRLYSEVLPDSTTTESPDVTRAGDIVVGVPNDGDWPGAEHPALALDDDVNTKYLHRKGGSEATGLQVGPLVGPTVVTGLGFTTANDVPTRDPITFELSGSNAGIDGPYTLIAAGDIVDFAGEAEWPRFTKNETPITFNNDVAYTYYQIVFPTLRGESQALMQIAEIELIGE